MRRKLTQVGHLSRRAQNQSLVEIDKPLLISATDLDLQDDDHELTPGEDQQQLLLDEQVVRVLKRKKKEKLEFSVNFM